MHGGKGALRDGIKNGVGGGGGGGGRYWVRDEAWVCATEEVVEVLPKASLRRFPNDEHFFAFRRLSKGIRSDIGSGGGGNGDNMVGDTGADGGGDAAVDTVHTEVLSDRIDATDDAKLGLLACMWVEVRAGLDGEPGVRKDAVRGGATWALGAVVLEVSGADAVLGRW